MRDAPRIAFELARGSIRSLRQNWGLGVLSLVLSFSFWLFVTGRETADRVDRVPGAVPVQAVNVPSDLAVVSISPDAVSVRVRAPEDIFDDLSADDFQATVDLSGVAAREVTAEVQVTTQLSDVEVRTVTPPRVTVRLESVTTRTVPVRTRIVGALPRGLELREVTVEPEQATVTGPESLIARVEAAEADVNVTGARVDFRQRVLLQPRDAQGGNIVGVTVEPDSAQVEVRVRQLEFSLLYTVRPQITGQPAEGYNVTAIEVDPPLVTLTGTLDALQNIDPRQGVPTASVSIGGATADVVRPVELQLPEGVEATVTTVTVRVRIAPADGEFSFSVVPEVDNAPPGSSVELLQPTVTVVLAGPVPTLRALSASAIRATLDLDGLGAGTHSVPVRVQAPPGTRIVSVTPPEVQVRVQ